MSSQYLTVNCKERKIIFISWAKTQLALPDHINTEYAISLYDQGLCL